VDAKKSLEDLIEGKSITVSLQQQVVFQEIENSPANLWNFLYFTGYLKAVSTKETEDTALVELKIPNIEVRRIFLNSVQYWFEQKKSLSLLQNLKTVLLRGM
jgi:DNA-directed RNA polymerase subunit N (RpoN/RPB10)